MELLPSDPRHIALLQEAATAPDQQETTRARIAALMLDTLTIQATRPGFLGEVAVQTLRQVTV